MSLHRYDLLSLDERTVGRRHRRRRRRRRGATAAVTALTVCLASHRSATRMRAHVEHSHHNTQQHDVITGRHQTTNTVTRTFDSP